MNNSIIKANLIPCIKSATIPITPIGSSSPKISMVII